MVKKYILGIETVGCIFEKNRNAYKFDFVSNYSSFRAVMIFPGDLVVAGCFSSCGGFF